MFDGHPEHLGVNRMLRILRTFMLRFSISRFGFPMYAMCQCFDVFYAGLPAQGVLDVQGTWSGTQQPSHRSDSLSWKQRPIAAYACGQVPPPYTTGEGGDGTYVREDWGVPTAG